MPKATTGVAFWLALGVEFVGWRVDLFSHRDAEALSEGNRLRSSPSSASLIEAGGGRGLIEAAPT